MLCLLGRYTEVRNSNGFVHYRQLVAHYRVRVGYPTMHDFRDREHVPYGRDHDLYATEGVLYPSFDENMFRTKRIIRRWMKNTSDFV